MKRKRRLLECVKYIRPKNLNRKGVTMLKKRIQPSEKTCTVTFALPADANAKTACLCGDFNQWDPSVHPMKKQKDGSFKIAVKLNFGQQYQFRYLLDGDRWENDWEADSYVPNSYGTENCLLNLLELT